MLRITRSDRVRRRTVARLLAAAVAIGACAVTTAGASRDVTAELRARELQRATATVAADTATLESLFASELQYGHANGVVDSKSALLAQLRSGTLRYERILLDGLTVQSAGDAALVRGRSAVRASGAKGAINRTLTYLAVYVWRDGRWQLVAYQSAPGAAR